MWPCNMEPVIVRMTSKTDRRQARRWPAVSPSHAARLAEKNRGRPAAGRSCAPAPISGASPPSARPPPSPSSSPPPCVGGPHYATLPCRPPGTCRSTRTVAGDRPSNPAQPASRSRPPICAQSHAASARPHTSDAPSSVPLLEKLSALFLSHFRGPLHFSLPEFPEFRGLLFLV